MNDKEKYNLLAEVLKRQHVAFNLMTDEQLENYVELMSIFLKSNDPILQESSVATMTLIVNNAKTPQ